MSSRESRSRKLRAVTPADPEPATHLVFEGLTVKQERFAQFVAHGYRYVEAYRKAYDVTDEESPAHYGAASQLASNPHVARRIKQLVSSELGLTSFASLATKDFCLSGMANLAMNAEKEQVRLNALIALGKTNVVRLFDDPDPSETVTRNVKDMSAAEIEAALREKLGNLIDVTPGASDAAVSSTSAPTPAQNASPVAGAARPNAKGTG